MNKQDEQVQLFYSIYQSHTTEIQKSKNNQFSSMVRNTTEILIDEANFQQLTQQNKQLRQCLILKDKQVKQKQVVIGNLIQLQSKSREQIKSLKQVIQQKLGIVPTSPSKWDKRQKQALIQKIVQITKLKSAMNQLKVKLAQQSTQKQMLKNLNKQLQDQNKVLMADNLKKCQFSVTDTQKYILTSSIGDSIYIDTLKTENSTLKRQKQMLQQENTKLKLQLAQKQKNKTYHIPKGTNILPKSGSTKNLNLKLFTQQKKTDKSIQRANKTTANHSFMNPTKASLQKQKNNLNTPRTSRSKSKSFQNMHK